MKTLIAAFACMTLLTTVTVAEENNTAPPRINIQWENPEDFTDMKAVTGNRERYRESTMEKFETYLGKLADELPEGHKLKMVITDVDLAGRVLPGTFVGMSTAQYVRVVEGIDIPRMNFTYELIDIQKGVIKSGEVKLKDMGFQQSSLKRTPSEALRYEKHMLKRWFEREFKDDMIAKN